MFLWNTFSHICSNKLHILIAINKSNDLTVKSNKSNICGHRRTEINTINHCAQSKCNDWTAEGTNAMIGWDTCQFTYLPSHTLQVYSFRQLGMCFEGGALKGGGGILFWVGYFQTQAKKKCFARYTVKQSLKFHSQLLGCLCCEINTLGENVVVSTLS